MLDLFSHGALNGACCLHLEGIAHVNGNQIDVFRWEHLLWLVCAAVADIQSTEHASIHEYKSASTFRLNHWFLTWIECTYSVHRAVILLSPSQECMQAWIPAGQAPFQSTDARASRLVGTPWAYENISSSAYDPNIPDRTRACSQLAHT